MHSDRLPNPKVQNRLTNICYARPFVVFGAAVAALLMARVPALATPADLAHAPESPNHPANQDNLDKRAVAVKQLRSTASVSPSAQEVLSADALVAKNPNDVKALRARAWVLQNHQRFITQGLKDIDKAIQLKPNDSDLYFVKARILLQMDEAEEALPWACKAVKTLPNNVDAWIDKGTIEMKMGNFTEALKSLNRAQGLNPKSPYLDYTQGRVFMGQRQWTEALKALSKALEMDPGMRDARLDRVVINVNLKNWLSVLADTEWLEKETPKAVEVIRRRAKALAELKKYDQAIVEYSKWEHIQENQRVPHEELAKLYAIVGNTRRAEFEARQVKVFDETFTLPIYTPKR